MRKKGFIRHNKVLQICAFRLCYLSGGVFVSKDVSIVFMVTFYAAGCTKLRGK